MQLFVIGLNHHTAPLDVREQAALGPAGIQEALGRLRAVTQEAVLLSTCNRTELYLVTQSSMDAAGCFRAAFPASPFDSGDYLFTSEGEEAVRHLFRVAGGVDSMVFGEAEIMGQVRRALELARDSGTVGAQTSRLFEAALARPQPVQRFVEVILVGVFDPQLLGQRGVGPQPGGGQLGGGIEDAVDDQRYDQVALPGALGSEQTIEAQLA